MCCFPRESGTSISLAVYILFLDLMVKLHCTAHTIGSGSILFHSLVYSVVLNLQLSSFYRKIVHNGCCFRLIHTARTKDLKRTAECGAESIDFY